MEFRSGEVPCKRRITKNNLEYLNYSICEIRKIGEENPQRLQTDARRRILIEK